MSKLNADPADDPWSDLVVSMLSVNQFPLERAYALLPGLQSEKLTDPAELSKRTPPEIYAKLIAAGYNRGEFMTYLFAERLVSLGTFVQSAGIANCETVMKGHDARALEKLLLPINGIGKVVMENLFLLRKISPKQHSM